MKETTSDDHLYLNEMLGAEYNAAHTKFMKGVAEHGGGIWEAPGMLKNLEEEMIDAKVYAYTLRKQLTEVHNLLKNDLPAQAEALLGRILL